MNINPGTNRTATNGSAARILAGLVSICLLAVCFAPEASAQADTTENNTIVYGKTDSVTLAIDAVLQEMFWRVRANDNSVFYENEYPHLRESMNLDTYLGGIRFRQVRRPNSDSIVAIIVDSASVTGDTALAHVHLVIRPPGSDTTHSKLSGQRLYRFNGAWIRPLSTTPKSYEEYTRRIQRYEEDADRESEE